jgi:transposase
MDTLEAGRYNHAPMKNRKAKEQLRLSETTVAPSAKRYDESFKRQAVEHWLKSDKPGTQIARELGISYPALKDWKLRYWGEAMPQRSDMAAENRALKAELARVREQRDILKKTLSIFSEVPTNVTNGLKR